MQTEHRPNGKNVAIAKDVQETSNSINTTQVTRTLYICSVICFIVCDFCIF